MKKLVYAAIILVFSAVFLFSAVVSASELPDFSSWTVFNAGAKDCNGDGVDDIVIFFLSENSVVEQSLSSALIFHFQPFDPRRIDMAIVLFYTRTSESGKDTILSVRLRLYGREDDGILFEERVIHRPQNVQEVIKEPMFDENSLFGRRWFREWRKFGLSDEEIRQNIPKWGWLPE